MGILHSVNKSPFSHSVLLSCLKVCSHDDSILLIEDGVFGALSSSPYATQLTELIERGVKVYALINDVNARGLQHKLAAQIHTTDYCGFVQLCEESSSVQSWY